MSSSSLDQTTPQQHHHTPSAEDDNSHHSTSQHSHNSHNSSFGTKDGLFFADMTLDLDEAMLESTPRMNDKFIDGDRMQARQMPDLPLFDPEEATDKEMARISSESAPPNALDTNTSNTTNTTTPLPRLGRRPRRPRDISWTASSLLFLPLGLILPHLYYSSSYIQHHNLCLSECTPLHPSWAVATSSSVMNSTVFFSCLTGVIVSLILMRMLYHTPGGGDGDDIRHVVVSRTLLLGSNLSIVLNPLLVVCIVHWLPQARGGAIVPGCLVVRDVWRARRTGSALPSFRGRGGNGSTRRGGGGTSSSSSHDRKTFFRALACAALDILSRSLRRRSFVRVASVLMGVQFVCVLLWWHALRVVLSVEIFQEDGIVTKFMHGLWFVCALVAGKWATGIVCRMLTLIASGGVSSWFAKQNLIVAQVAARELEMQALEQQQTAPTGQSIDGGSDDTYSTNKANARAALHAMPEAYRTADAAVYAVMDFDDGVDDDYHDDGQEDTSGGRGRYNQIHRSNDPSLGRISSSDHTSTVKSFLISGCTISFGSVAQCGLVGGLAQFLWSVCRNMDAMGFFLQRRFSSTTSGFRGMDISSSSGGMGNSWQWKQTVAFWWRKLDVAIRGFVRGHSDLAMSHVAAYYKGYQRAANDVAALIETSGVEPIIHDDITTHMCSCLCSVVSGLVVIFFGMLLVTHRNATLTASKNAGTPMLEDSSLFEILLFSYILCYTLLFTALEPLRAGIKAVYVCFAEHPLSLSQAFPLIYQRLSRISEASVSM